MSSLTGLVQNQSQAVDTLMQTVDNHSEGMKNLTAVVETLTQARLQNEAELMSVQADVDQLNNTTQRTNSGVSSLTRELHMLETVYIQDKAQLSGDINRLKAAVGAGRQGELEKARTTSFIG